ncbi:hypothetical protein [Sphingobacterium sp. FBM7-1]|uniref:hypothetical protein n=1 Tax=Sphingobacterium sp. FBM7-1 TaxID=2886688 RepID=UPI001D11978A|nr:hypothetical protein [Sphingobacterium sp. FBM7-1]MCC2598054.1 hypothetical protein [Sphingobacterium sp. FBM7-1]
MEDNIVHFDKDTPKIAQANKVKSLLAVNGDDDTIGSVEFDLLVLEAGKNVGGAVKFTGTELPELGEGNVYLEVYGGVNGKVLTYESNSIEILPNTVAKLFGDGINNTWEKTDEAYLPVDANSVKKDEIGVEGGVAEYDTVAGITSKSKNYVDTKKLEAGYIDSLNGGYTSSLNWIRYPYSTVPNELKGKQVTIGPFGSVPAGGLAVSFRDNDGIWMNEDSVGGSGSATPQFITVIVPANAKTWGFTPANDPSNNGIGTRPNDNVFSNSFIANEGTETIPYEPFGVSVKSEKIDRPDSIKFSNEITEEGEGAVPSSKIFRIKESIDSVVIPANNLVDTSEDVVRGYWNLSGSHNNSSNWIKTVRKRLPQSILDKLDNHEQVFLAVNGGGSVPSSGGAAVIFWSASGAIEQIIAGSGNTTYPSVYEVPQGAVDYAFSVANQSSNGGIGLRPLDNDFTNSFMVSEGIVQLPYEPFGYKIDPAKLPQSSNSKYDLAEVIVRKTSDNYFHIYYHIGGNDNMWFRINLRRFTNESRFIDVWRLDEGWIVMRNNDVFTNIRQVILTGVYENAIYLNEPSYNNALGSSHGWEMLSDDGFSLFMDGKRIDVDGIEKDVKGRYLTFCTKTGLKKADGSGDVASSFKKWEFRNGVLKLKNSIDWKEHLYLRVGSSNGAFVTMCSVMRSDILGNITHSAMSNEDGTIYDVSQAGFTTTINTDFQNTKRNSIVLWGDEFKAEVSMIKKQVILGDGGILPYAYSNSGMFVKNTTAPNYNKIYGTMGGNEVNPGDFWDVETEYKFSNINQ